MNQRNAKGQKHGPWEYSDNGKLSNKVTYVNGKIHGSWESYYTDGKLCSKGTYINDIRYGLWVWYFSNGELLKKYFYL
jgi:antitoxin component YwqK of YwqJK toxin-antitoxin module